MFASFIPSPSPYFCVLFSCIIFFFLHINKNLEKKKCLDFFFITCIAKYSVYPCAASVFRETKLIKTWYQISVCARQAQLQDDGTVTRGGGRLMSRANWADQRNNDCVVPMVVVIVLLGTWSKNKKRSDQKKKREKRNERKREREGREREKKDRSQ